MYHIRVCRNCPSCVSHTFQRVLSRRPRSSSPETSQSWYTLLNHHLEQTTESRRECECWHQLDASSSLVVMSRHRILPLLRNAGIFNGSRNLDQVGLHILNVSGLSNLVVADMLNAECRMQYSRTTFALFNFYRLYYPSHSNEHRIRIDSWHYL